MCLAKQILSLFLLLALNFVHCCCCCCFCQPLAMCLVTVHTHRHAHTADEGEAALASELHLSGSKHLWYTPTTACQRRGCGWDIDGQRGQQRYFVNSPSHTHTRTCREHTYTYLWTDSWADIEREQNMEAAFRFSGQTPLDKPKGCSARRQRNALRRGAAKGRAGGLLCHVSCGICNFCSKQFYMPARLGD